MITVKKIEKLMKISSEKYPILSLYLGMSPAISSQKQYKTLAKSLIKQGTSNLSKFDDSQRNLIAKDCQKLSNFIEYEFERKSQSIAVFSSTGLGLWQVHPLPRRVKSRFVIDIDPYTRPLVRFLDENEKYFIAYVDSKRARLFSIYTGVMNERNEILDEEVPGKHKQGGWSQSRFQRHIKNRSAKHLKNISDIIHELYKVEKFDHLIIGGSLEALHSFRHMLHSSLQKIIVAQVQGSLDDSVGEIYSSAEKIIDSFETKQSKKYLNLFFDRKGKKHLASSGFSDIVRMLRQARIHTLLVKTNLVVPGFRCSNCEAPYLKQISKCDFCGKKVVKVPDIIDEIIENVWDQNGEVKFIKTSKELDKLGGIAALLRW